MTLLAFPVLLALAQSPAGEPPPAPERPPSGASPENQPVAPTPPDIWELARVRVPWSEPSGEGLAFGYENGSWGGLFSQGLRVRVPLARAFALTARGVYMGESVAGAYRPNLGARIELIGGTPVYLNLIRIYGGGGVQAFFPVGSPQDASPRWGGGGHFGLEFFLTRRASFFLEIGGQAGGPAPGATILAGLSVYPF